jgi:hypothetical protein
MSSGAASEINAEDSPVNDLQVGVPPADLLVIEYNVVSRRSANCREGRIQTDRVNEMMFRLFDVQSKRGSYAARP